ncbi:TPM domain-containing protein [Sphingomonas sp. SUN039]|nr:TPM domain-containing protein [Sphingomonas sp. SUN039]
MWRALLALLLLLCAFPAFAQTFPPLTGRVVDAANILQPDAKAALEAKLEGVEKATGHQVVIATIPDMQGYPLEDYGYRLGRTWALGDKEKDDGLIILLAPNNPTGQRGPRIEVGYGLEPLVTDAFSSVVANGIMTPMLKAGDIPGALNAGVDAIAEQIKLTPEEAAKRTAELAASEKSDRRSVNPGAFLFWIAIFFFVLLPMIGALSRGGRRRTHSSGLGEAILWTAINAAVNSRGSDDDHWGGGGGGGWGGGGGGGFSGGGGSFGGGGASGGW